MLFAALLTDGLVASASGTPETRAAAVRLTAAPVEAAFPIDFVGVQWEGEASPAAAVRFRHGRTWGEWQALAQDDLEEPGRFASSLVPAADADAYQVRVPSSVADARAVAIDTTGGPTRRLGLGTASVAGADTAVISRAGWGADEALMTWAPAYYPAQKLTVHHTDTANADADPAATVRAIYRYHAVDRGWGDIGYQYLVDEAGRVYEGRSSGSDGLAAHDATGTKVVTGAHTDGWNSGNVGVALLGTLTTRGPTAAARTSLESVLADLAGRHGLDPTRTSTYTNPVNGAVKTVPNIAGHRDYGATECPGGALYALLPSIRTNVAGRLGGTTSTTSTTPTTTAPKTVKTRR